MTRSYELRRTNYALRNARSANRCGKESHGTIMSKFNLDSLCFDCHDEEKQAPGYSAADAAELAACRSSDYNFEGVGLSTADSAFLAEMRRQRDVTTL